LIQDIKLCIQCIKKLIDKYINYKSICKQLNNITFNDYEYNKYFNKNNKILKEKKIKQDLIKLYNLKTLVEEQLHNGKNTEIQINISSPDLYFEMIRNQEYLDKINTVHYEIINKSIKVFKKYKYVNKILNKITNIKNEDDN